MIHRQGMEGAAIPNPLYLMREKVLDALEGSVLVLVRVMERAGQAQRYGVLTRSALGINRDPAIAVEMDR